jgi:hypothetical protein
MDMKEASDMTEASGPTNDRGSMENVAGERRSAEQEVASRGPSSSELATSFADRLRRVTLKAPLQSLFIAFMLGVWIARRR